MPSKINFTKQQEEEIIRLYERELLSIKKMEGIFGISDKPIMRVLKNNNINTNSSHRKKRLFAEGKLLGKKIIFSDSQIKEIINLYESKIQNMQGIGKKFGVSNTTIRHLLNKKGVDTSPKKRRILLFSKGKIGIKNRISKEQTKEMIKLYEEDLFSIKRISKKFGIYPFLISKILRENKINTTFNHRMEKLANSGKLISRKVFLVKGQSKKIIKLYEKDLLTMREISKIFGVGYNIIHHLLIENKVNTSKSYRKKLYCGAGKIESWNKGLTKETDERVKQATENMMKANKGKIPHNKRTDLDENKIVSLYKNNEKILDIAKKFNCSNGPIHRILRENNISVSQKGKANTKEHTRKMVETRMKNGSYESPRKNKKWVDYYGEEKAKAMRNKLSSTHKRLHQEGKLEVWNKNKKHEEDKRILAGEKHPLFNNWASLEPYDKSFNDKFKRAIRKRDNQICMACGIHREKLNRALSIHHANYDKLVSIPQNCVSLCQGCHSKTNVNRLHWIKFFQSILSKNYGYKYSENGEIILNFYSSKKTKHL